MYHYTITFYHHNAVIKIEFMLSQTFFQDKLILEKQNKFTHNHIISLQHNKVLIFNEIMQNFTLLTVTSFLSIVVEDDSRSCNSFYLLLQHFYRLRSAQNLSARETPTHNSLLLAGVGERKVCVKAYPKRDDDEG